MPFLETFKKLISRSPKIQEQSQEQPQVSNPGQLAFRVGLIQLATNAPTAINNGQLANPGNTISSVASIQQPPVGSSNNTTGRNDRATDLDDAIIPGVPIVSTSSSVLANAHHFTIGQLTAISQNIHCGTTVLQQPGEKGKLTATHDSSARAYPPRCHPGTRETLRSRIVRWGMGDENDERMFWTLGPPAVGKSAVAQTIAEEFEEKGRLGASFFFSRPNHLDDPDWVIPTLVYQLATKHPQYKHIITQRLADDPSILEKNRQAQFKKLIIEPFCILMAVHPHTVQEPLLIILDGLDECKDKQAQCEFIELIGTHVREVKEFPLRWMICSRPEWHLKFILSDTDFRVACEREELHVYEKEARKDVERLFEAGLVKVRQKYSDRLPDDWPPEDHLRRITTVASGHLGLASFILRFIGDEEYDDPDGQLRVCMRFLGGGSTTGAINPLHALDLLYRQILSGVPLNRLPTAMRILGLAIVRPRGRSSSGLRSSDNQAKFLNLGRAAFHQSLQHLHSVVYIPPMNKFNTTSIRIYHASFSDFLMDPNRSGNFHLNKAAVNYDIVLQCLDWMENDDGSLSNKDVIKFCASQGWDACRKLSDEFIPILVSRLEYFNFRRLTYEHIKQFGVVGEGFGKFLSWLHSLGSVHNKFLISVVNEISQEEASESKAQKLHHWIASPHDYIASFIPDVGTPQLPFTLNLRLGKVAHVFISLTVDDPHRVFGGKHTQRL